MAAGIYVHIPFCLRKCSYCSFNSCTYEQKAAREYISALEDEAKVRARLEGASTLYIGGGTPTVVVPRLLARAVERIAELHGLPPGAEATLEANPGTLVGYDPTAILDAGVNRVSLGAQSFIDPELKKLGRLHNASDTAKSIEIIRGWGIRNIGLDLIYAIPGQDVESWEASLAAAIELSPEHISVYCLSVEDNTQLHRDVASGKIKTVPENLQAQMYDLAVEFLEKSGYCRYEISNFARPGFECRHNANYWRAGDFIGLGAGAYSSVGRKRRVNIHRVKDYTGSVLSGRDPEASIETVSSEEARKEFIMLALRTREGLSLDEYASRFGRRFMEEYGAVLERLGEGGFMTVEGGSARLAGRGIFASNEVISEFF